MARVRVEDPVAGHPANLYPQPANDQKSSADGAGTTPSGRSSPLELPTGSWPVAWSATRWAAGLC